MPSASTLAYAIAIFMGAFLLFAVQLLLGKYFLPWFGGTPAMWTTCMLFFQLALLLGYAYAHIVATAISARSQAWLHGSLLLLSLSLLVFLERQWHSPLLPSLNWRPGAVHPIGSILLLLTVSAGLPYFALSSTGPLLQSWFTQTHPGRNPYRLYALSNIGSFLALLSYPLLLEPYFSLQKQARFWALGFVIYAASSVVCLVGHARSRRLTEDRTIPELGMEKDNSVPGIKDHVLWIALAACASVLFLATTSQICENVAVVPLLWVLPLSVYLLTFVICFDRSRWYKRSVFHPGLALSLFLAGFVSRDGALSKILIQLLIYSFVLFVCCMVRHGELVRSKPATSRLTSFYLMVALGGATGGIFVVVIAPNLLRGYWEYHIGLWCSVLLLFVVLLRDRSSWLYCSRFGIAGIAVATALLPSAVSWATSGRASFGDWIPAATVLIAALLLTQKGRSGFDPRRARAAPWFCAMALLVLGAVLFVVARSRTQNTVLMSRSFYGVLTVQEMNAQKPDEAYSLSHGRIVHGFQFQAENLRAVPTSYYGTSSGLGQAVAALQGRAAPSRPIRIGVVGLGIGTTAAHARQGDYLRFYEINPDVVRLANDRRYFTFLTDSPAKIDIVLGDARLSMERELNAGQPQQLDLLCLDAFSGDATPVHLLTEEAFRIYLHELREDGILAVHITNGYLDFRPLLSAMAARFGLASAFAHSDGDGKFTIYNDWVLVSRNHDVIAQLLQHSAVPLAPSTTRLWTDDYSNLVQALRHR